MDAFSDLIWPHGKFLGIEWGVWKVVGWLGNLVFFSRFFVQWYATEKLKRVVVPTAFWWLSLFGGLALFSYAVHRQDPVFILGQGVGIFVYVRNLMLIAKKKRDGRRKNGDAWPTSCTTRPPRTWWP